ncbi:hypothetical protein [Aquibacillus albus]|uniref:Membrane protein n=1 Tax=Aquibacillus albus TaxID=1168171 RepID=A0ABS2MZC6_9BACI|nr:hypothetical protein [Aquibacillus albus]MBM7571210.1 putative membrane protein [Aquibacillus albus]
MRFAFTRIFWGFIFVLLEIHIVVIDVLPDPIGYFLIYYGLTSLSKEFPSEKKASNLAMVLLFLSIPTVFVQQTNAGQSVQTFSLLSGWSIYAWIVSIANIVLVFFIFQLLVEIVRKYGDEALIIRTSRIFKAYILIMLVIEIFNPFSVNLSPDFMIGISILFVILPLVMQIIFLVLLWSYRKLDSTVIYRKK